MNNLKSSPRSPRPKINQLCPNDDRHDEKHFQTIIYHNSRVEPLFYDGKKHRKLLLLLHVFFLINIYGAKVITSVLLDYFLFLAYSVIYYYASFLMQLNEIIKNTDFVVYLASYLWHCYSETRGLDTATLVATSSSSLHSAEA